MNIIKAQNDCIEVSLGKAIKHLVNNSINTLVLPLAIPTGFGKTRIAIQGAIHTLNNEGKKINGTIVLWPQKKSHITDAWKSSINWEKNISEIEEGKRFDKISWKPLVEKFSAADRNSYEGKHLFWVKSSDEWTKNEIAAENLRKKGPIIFIIDEWHNKKLIEKFQKFESDKSNVIEKAEEFWRGLLLPQTMCNSRRKLFVLLVSATPIATTIDMDEKKIVKDDDYDRIITTAYDDFKILTKIGHQNSSYNFLENSYNVEIKNEVAKLKPTTEELRCFKVYGKKEDFLDEYIGAIRYLRISNKDQSLVYLAEQLNFVDSQSLKIQALFDLLEYYQDRKFIVFCHHVEVAKKITMFLQERWNVGSEVVYYSEFEDDDKPSDRQAKSAFNNKNDKQRILVLTDKDSQGIDLHKSNAWIVHYELAWNPIRIIQRFGRVWRIVKRNGETKMTRPLAFYLPFTYSSEEEQINRLKRRWRFLEKLDAEFSKEKAKKRRTSMNFAAIPMEIALGTRWTPEP